jgi:hypothetical protein
MNFGIYDSLPELYTTKPKEIVLGIIGTQSNFEEFSKWVDAISNYIAAKPSNQPNLFTSFSGFNEYEGFKAKMVYNNSYFRQINETEINKIIRNSKKNKDIQSGIKDVAQIYLRNIEFLAENKTPNVIICLISDSLWDKLLKIEKDESMDISPENEDENSININFRSYLKAYTMKYRIPIQLLRERSLAIKSETIKGSLQDLATRAWNFCTAIYYKSGGVPWKAIFDENDLTCFLVLAFIGLWIKELFKQVWHKYLMSKEKG